MLLDSETVVSFLSVCFIFFKILSDDKYMANYNMYDNFMARVFKEHIHVCCLKCMILCIDSLQAGNRWTDTKLIHNVLLDRVTVVNKGIIEIWLLYTGGLNMKALVKHLCHVSTHLMSISA